MTKLVIQIPCLNEAATLPETVAHLPRCIAGIDTIEVLVIDDGSTDGTAEVARICGVQHVVRHRRNRGLAAAFQTGLDSALAVGADVIVNTDADGQYVAEDIARLVAPVIAAEADIVVGDRGVGDNAHFGPVKRWLQRLGSSVVRRMSGTDVADAVSGFRALSRSAAQSITITTEFTYTTDMLIQAGRKRMKIVSVPVRTRPTVRRSRLFRSIPQFIALQLVTMSRAYAMYNPLRTFALIGGVLTLVGMLPILRFVYYYLIGQGQGHLQSLVLGGALVVIGFLSGLMGILADLIGANRKILETTLTRLRQIEERLGEGNTQARGTPRADGEAGPAAGERR